VVEQRHVAKSEGGGFEREQWHGACVAGGKASILQFK
jgi:hypothetical protein